MGSIANANDRIAAMIVRTGAICIQGLPSHREFDRVPQAWGRSRAHRAPDARPPLICDEIENG